MSQIHIPLPTHPTPQKTYKGWGSENVSCMILFCFYLSQKAFITRQVLTVHYFITQMLLICGWSLVSTNLIESPLCWIFFFMKLLGKSKHCITLDTRGCYNWYVLITISIKYYKHHLFQRWGENLLLNYWLSISLFACTFSKLYGIYMHTFLYECVKQIWKSKIPKI